MNPNVIIINGSPKGTKGNSESIANSLMDKLLSQDLEPTKIILKSQLSHFDHLMEVVNQSDILILVLPVYQNSVPGLVLQFFEMLEKNKEKLDYKVRKMAVISNSGFPEPSANMTTIEHCKLFALSMDFEWLIGALVAPGTLIDGKNLDETGNTYKKVIALLDIIAKKIRTQESFTDSDLQLTSKSFISPFMYRFFGKLLQKKVIKKLGKEKYFAQPFQ